ncbi:MAG: GH92 family glycosyl hydrolase [Bacteroidota bacterium]
MIRFLKWFFGIIGSIILIIALLIGGYWWKYRSFVDTPNKEISSLIKTQYPIASKVNPFIGTGGVPWTCAYDFPGVTMPFGVMRLGPETASMLNDQTALNTSGYFYGDDKIIGFSHTRLIGTGATDGGHFLVLPVNGSNEFEGTQQAMYKYSHDNELAYPGYYSLELPDENMSVELTATERVGFHRYRFSSSANSGLLFDITHVMGNKRSEDGYLRIIDDHQIEGHSRNFGSFGGRYGGEMVYFAAQFSQPIRQNKIRKGQDEFFGVNEVEGDKILIYFGFNSDEVELKLAISHVSIENAWENLEAEIGEKSFDDVLADATKKWNDQLSVIDISGGTQDQQTIFYSALYRSFQMPTIYNDVNGEYLGFDKQIHQADSFRYFTDMSIWDTFRTVHPLYNLVARRDQRDMIVSLTKMAEQGGWLPRWPSGSGYTNSMLGTASDIVISEAYQKGIRDFDVDFAYQNMKEIALNPMPKGSPFSGREGNASCRLYGYCPADSMDEAVSRTLEFAWSDYSIGLLAKELGKEEDASLFQKLAMNYKNTWNPETKFFQARNADGQFDEHFKPLLLTYVDGDETYTNDYVEGSAMQWRWAPFFDTKGLVDLFKSKDYFITELNQFFEQSDYTIGYWYPGSYYWHGNEPDIHTPYMFNYVGRPDLTQKWVRSILDTKYLNRYDGMDGNDDGGTLSAWYIFSALGFYPVAGTPVYQLGAPLFEKSVINIGKASLKIVARNYDPANIYVSQIHLNGVLLNRTWIMHDEIKDGGMIEFTMSAEPLIAE